MFSQYDGFGAYFGAFLHAFLWKTPQPMIFCAEFSTFYRENVFRHISG